MKWEQRVRLALVLAAVGCSRHPASCCAHAPTSPAAAVGPFDVAARYFAGQSGPKALAKAALAFHKAGLDADAHAAADKAIAAGRGDASEAPVRALRAELAESEGQVALAADDWRF